MTSTPASRSARATTFAPRSCPSRPAFATITRILLMTASVTGTPRGSVRPAVSGRSVDAGDAVLGDDRAALRARGRQGRRGVRRGRRGAGDPGVRAQVHLDVTGRHRGA